MLDTQGETSLLSVMLIQVNTHANLNLHACSQERKASWRKGHSSRTLKNLKEEKEQVRGGKEMRRERRCSGLERRAREPGGEQTRAWHVGKAELPAGRVTV